MNSVYKRIGVASLLLLPLALCGCTQALFPMQQQRSQFESYNTMRHGPPILEQPDPFGLPEPALRARLERNHE